MPTSCGENEGKREGETYILEKKGKIQKEEREVERERWEKGEIEKEREK